MVHPPLRGRKEVAVDDVPDVVLALPVVASQVPYRRPDASALPDRTGDEGYVLVGHLPRSGLVGKEAEGIRQRLPDCIVNFLLHGTILLFCGFSKIITFAVPLPT